MNLLPRTGLELELQRALGRSRAVVLIGPRQSGKTTLAGQRVARDSPRWFDLENPLDRVRLAEPMSMLGPLLEAGDGPIVIDEVQHAPALFPVLRVLIDRSERAGQFLLLGSASPALLRQAGESLLGRIETIEVGGFDLAEVGVQRQQRLWVRGGYPRAYLATSDDDAAAWRLQAVARHVEQDLPQFGINVPAPAMLRFWSMLAHRHGQIWNAADPARSLGFSEQTARRYLDTLTQTFMLRQLQPWHANVDKRQVKAPKVYFRDSGLLHALLGLKSLPELLAHPVCGASWEGFALEQVLRLARPDAAYFWATHNGAELDLLLFKGERRIGVEFKRADAPTMTRSMHVALADLALHALYVVYPGTLRYRLGERVEAVPLAALLAG
ncbi:MAG: ATP-binding protein [Rubrivivax sp.]|nr:ATP-binding protein [Rubrivivax sp.]